MAKTIEVIDLLNKIANREELPEKIKWNFDENIYTYDGGGYLCYSTGYAKEKAFLEGYRTDMVLHTTVEILEEQQDIDIQEMTGLDEFYIQGLEVSGYSMTQAEYLLEGGIAENRELINIILQWAKQIDKKYKR